MEMEAPFDGLLGRVVLETLSGLSARQSFVSVVQRVKQGRSQVNIGDVMSNSFKSDAVSHANI